MKEKVRLRNEIEEFFQNILTDYEGDDLKEVAEFIQVTVEDFLSIVDESEEE